MPKSGIVSLAQVIRPVELALAAGTLLVSVTNTFSVAVQPVMMLVTSKV